MTALLKGFKPMLFCGGQKKSAMRNKIIASAITLLALCANCYCLDDTLDGYFGCNSPYYETGFTDLDSEHWAYEAVSFLARYGIVSGNEGLFCPNEEITRAQFIKILILSFGLFEKDAECSFFDLQKNNWAYPYIASAVKLNIATGVSATDFGANNPLQRQQLAVLTYKTALFCGIVFHNEGDINFTDKNSVADYALEAVAALSQNGMINGDENNMFNPADAATRAQACKIIYSLVKKLL